MALKQCHAVLSNTTMVFMATSGRIDIDGQRRLCDQEMAISRSMPAVLADRMMYSSWTSFCDKVDEALLPAAKAKSRMAVFIVFLVALIIGMVLFGFIAFSRDSNSDSYHNEGLSMIPYFVAFLLTVGGIITLMCLGARVRHRIEEDVENVCDGISTLHCGIYMHVMKERYVAGQLGGNFRSDSSIYIEVRVGYEAPTPPPETSDVEDGKQTPSENIADETDETKGLLEADNERGQQTSEGSTEVRCT